MINGILPSAPVEPGAPASTLNAYPNNPTIQQPLNPSSVPSDPSTLSSPPNTPTTPLPSNNPSIHQSNNPSFPLYPAETPRAFAAFMAYFQLGHTRSYQAVADHLSEKLRTIRAWASRFHWPDRINAYNSGLLEQHAQAEAEVRRKEAADWSRRSSAFREQEWAATQKLLAAAQCFLESFGDREVAHMSLGQVSRALQVASHLARQTLTGTIGSQEPALTPLQMELEAALKRAYSQPFPAPDSPPVEASAQAVQPSTPNSLSR